jgi:pilus assembly protein Flp/PilA
MLACLSDTCRRFWRDENGATAIEYGLIAAGIAVAIIVVVFSIGTELQTTFNRVVTCLQNPAACPAANTGGGGGGGGATP